MTILRSYSVRVLVASVLTDVGLAFGVVVAGGAVDWRLLAYSAGKTVLLGAARLLLGESPEATHPG